ncbi:MAG: glutamate--tRNA ligase, partial [Proteobacteria bacterium]|nr:glutamate--tRNA ligase [Pseudomonadota bacterium]
MGKPNQMVRTRFAPSPTGELHVGGARTALFNWLLAKKTGGAVVLRVEDTDKERSKVEFESAFISGLSWLGVDFDEGPHTGGEFGPYRQSERTAIYKEYVGKLLDTGAAYRCYCTKERLSELRAGQVKGGIAPGYDGLCRQLKEAPEKEVDFVIRFHVKGKEVRFIDGLRGERVFDAALISDFIIMNSKGDAAFLFASALDDALMEITDVIRGDDHISNTPGQILLLEALGLKAPAYTHIPLILGADRKPLSKRTQSASLESLKRDGFLPEAVLNTIARLGWAPHKGARHKGEKDALLTLEELTGLFDLEVLSKSASVFDLKRLKRFNKDALGKADPELLLDSISSWFKKIDRQWLLIAITLVKEEAESTKDIVRLLSPLIGVLTITSEASKILTEPQAVDVVKALADEIKASEKLDQQAYLDIIDALKKKTERTGKALFMPVRAALTGCTSGIELSKVMRL